MVREAVPPDIAAYVNAYVQAVGELPFVERVLVDDSEGLTIYTVYQGNLAEIAAKLYGAEARVIGQFPHERVRFETLDSRSAHDHVLPADGVTPLRRVVQAYSAGPRS